MEEEDDYSSEDYSDAALAGGGSERTRTRSGGRGGCGKSRRNESVPVEGQTGVSEGQSPECQLAGESELAGKSPVGPTPKHSSGEAESSSSEEVTAVDIPIPTSMQAATPGEKPDPPMETDEWNSSAIADASTGMEMEEGEGHSKETTPTAGEVVTEAMVEEEMRLKEGGSRENSVESEDQRGEVRGIVYTGSGVVSILLFMHAVGINHSGTSLKFSLQIFAVTG